MLDPAVATEDRVEELGDVADRVDAGPLGGEALVDDDPAPHLEAGGDGELDVRLDADAGDDEVGVRDLRRLEPQVDAVLAVDGVERLGERRRLRAARRPSARARSASP